MISLVGHSIDQAGEALPAALLKPDVMGLLSAAPIAAGWPKARTARMRARRRTPPARRSVSLLRDERFSSPRTTISSEP